MLSALRSQGGRPGLPRPLPRRLVLSVPAAVPRSGDGAGEQLPALRRPERRLPPPPADEVQPAWPTSPRRQRQRQPAAEQPVSGSIAGGGRLTAQLKAASSPEKVVQLVQQAEVGCSAADLTTAVNHLVKLYQRDHCIGDRCRAAFQQLAQIALSQQLDPWSVAQFFWAAGKLWEGVAVMQPFGDQQVAWQQRMTAAFAARECKPQSISNGLLGASKLGWRLEGSLAAAADAAVHRHATRMTSQHVCNTLWAFANAGWAPGSGASAALLQRLEQVLPQAQPQEVSNSLWAMPKLGLHPSDSLQAAFGQALQHVISSATSQNLANILLACGKLHWSPGGRILAAAVAAMQQLLAAGAVKAQHVCNFLWGLAELQEHLGIKLPAELPALLAAAAEWADCRWAQLSSLNVVDLCYNLARLGHRPGSTWVVSVTERCLECIARSAAPDVGYGSFIWACSEWGHQLQRSELEQLVPAAVDHICATWPEPGRGSGLRLAECLTRQTGFRAGPDCPAATAALECRLLPLVCADIDLIAADQLCPQIGKLPYLAGWAATLAAIGLRLPEQQLEAVCSYVGRHPQLQQGDRRYFEKAFRAWGCQPGLALLGQMENDI